MDLPQRVDLKIGRVLAKPYRKSDAVHEIK
jgi:hypothetical protein